MPDPRPTTTSPEDLDTSPQTPFAERYGVIEPELSCAYETDCRRTTAGRVSPPSVAVGR